MKGRVEKLDMVPFKDPKTGETTMMSAGQDER
jgi:hypothetical protein